MPADQDALIAARQQFQNGNLAEAEALCGRLLEANPRDAEALNLRGMIAHQRGELAQAAEVYRKAIAARPSAAGYYNNLGVSLLALGKTNEAAEACAKAALLNPESAQIQTNLGNALQTLGRTAEASAAQKKAVALRPDHPEAHNGLALSLYMAGDLESSLAEFKTAAQLRPDFASAWSNSGNVLRDLGRIDEAAAAYRRAISIQVDHPDARKNLALIQLLQGDYAHGFLEYEWRWKCADSPPRKMNRPRWTGEDPDGKTILVYEEQGFGDIIQFARYLGVLSGRGARVIFGCRPALGRLMSACAGVAQVTTVGQAMPPFDLHCPLQSLPLLCGTTAPTQVPAHVPYFHLPEDLKQLWCDRLGPSQKLRVGLCWAGNPENRNDRFRSMPLKQFVLLRVAGQIEFHSLQVGPAAAQIPSVSELALVDHQSNLSDFADTAGLISQLDLVISVDTAVAHLAGAMGKPVWVLIPSAPDWRWLLDRADSPWYPTARLFRQTRDWAPVIDKLKFALEERLRQTSRL
jgi:Flp pilus assembly protein TadD